VAIHGDKEQEERERSIDAFKSGEKDVLVATDVASKVCVFWCAWAVCVCMCVCVCSGVYGAHYVCMCVLVRTELGVGMCVLLCVWG
jgi:hypothetical protein